MRRSPLEGELLSRKPFSLRFTGGGPLQSTPVLLQNLRNLTAGKDTATVWPSVDHDEWYSDVMVMNDKMSDLDTTVNQSVPVPTLVLRSTLYLYPRPASDLELLLLTLALVIRQPYLLINVPPSDWVTFFDVAIDAVLGNAIKTDEERGTDPIVLPYTNALLVYVAASDFYQSGDVGEKDRRLDTLNQVLPDGGLELTPLTQMLLSILSKSVHYTSTVWAVQRALSTRAPTPGVNGIFARRRTRSRAHQSEYDVAERAASQIHHDFYTTKDQALALAIRRLMATLFQSAPLMRLTQPDQVKTRATAELDEIVRLAKDRQGYLMVLLQYDEQRTRHVVTVGNFWNEAVQSRPLDDSVVLPEEKPMSRSKTDPERRLWRITNNDIKRLVRNRREPIYVDQWSRLWGHVRGQYHTHITKAPGYRKGRRVVLWCYANRYASVGHVPSPGGNGDGDRRIELYTTSPDGKPVDLVGTFKPKERVAQPRYERQDAVAYMILAVVS